MPTKTELEIKIRNAQHRAFISKMIYLGLGLIGGWLACYIYVIHFGGSFPPRGTFAKFLSQSWGMFSGIFVPIIVALITSYINRKKRQGDG